MKFVEKHLSLDICVEFESWVLHSLEYKILCTLEVTVLHTRVLF